MKFQARLNRYLIGVVIGLVLVAMFFGGRDWLSWLPGPQVKRQLTEAFQNPTSEMQKELDCSGFTAEIIQSILKDGDVDFRRSDTRSEPRKYWLGFETEEGEHLEMQFRIVGETAEIMDWSPKKACAK
ncbi:MAG: DUF4258 domain-containing protein [Flavobacteriales bacterium]|nr:DUF4258 domain-containing protein [Flavobacteriales bacterium]